MLGEIVLAILLGLLFGIFTGLIPGIHINLVAVVLLTISPLLLQVTSPLMIACFILSMSITHTFTDFIASVYLGAPDDDTALSVLPGHVLLLQGKAFEAIRLTLIGSLCGLVLTVALTPLLLVLVPYLFDLFKPYIGIILLAISAFMIVREPTNKKRMWALLVFLSSGTLGILVLTNHAIQDPLFPLLSGLFGVSMLLHSLSQNTTIPAQKITETIIIKPFESFKATIAGVGSGSLLSIFPGLGPAQAAILGSQFYKTITNHAYLVLVGSINTVVMIMSLVTLFTIDKARNGSIVAVQELIPTFGVTLLLTSLCVCLVAGGIATFATLTIGKVFSKVMTRINYKALSMSIIAFICILAFFFNGFVGLAVLAVSTSIGLLPVLTDVGRNHGMGVLLLPVMMYFLV